LTPVAKLSPGGEFCPLGVKLSPGVKFSVRPSILLNYRECSPLVLNNGVNIPPRGQISPLGVKLRMALCPFHLGQVQPGQANHGLQDRNCEDYSLFLKSCHGNTPSGHMYLNFEFYLTTYVLKRLQDIYHNCVSTHRENSNMHAPFT
jgi:hypothetical protein